MSLTTDLGTTPEDGVKGCLTFMVALIVTGVVAETLYNANPTAAYLFVAIVLIGYAATGGNLATVQAFFDSVSKGSKTK